MTTMSDCLILVDNSNVFIEGQKFAAKQRKLDVEFDVTWRIDFGALLREVANGHKIIKAVLVGSVPPPSDSMWNAARLQGFEVITHERKRSGEKQVDTQITMLGAKVLYREHPQPAVLKLLSGDLDFKPLITEFYNEGWENELWGFSSGMSSDLAMVAHRVKLLDKVFDKIGKFDI